MNFETIEKNVNPWEYMCERWNMFAPPGRPSKRDVEKYKKLLYNSFAEEQPSYNVLVLGATPEIRDMLAQDKRINVFLVDITMDMIMSMTQLMDYTNDSEVWIKSNWLNMPLPDNYFDAILSDLVICNVDEKSHDIFFKEILRILKKDGHWLNRVYFVDNNTKIRKLEDLIIEYCEGDLTSKGDINNFRSTAGLIAWNKEKKLLDWSILYDEMKKYIQDGQFSHPIPKANVILQGTYDLFKPFNKKYFLDSEEGNDNEFSQYFHIYNRVNDEESIALKEKAYYIYDLTRKISI